jgi:hypothetical protein
VFERAVHRPNSNQAACVPVKRPFLLTLNYVHASFVIVRDRVIFIVKGNTVKVLSVRGADSGTMFDAVGEED